MIDKLINFFAGDATFNSWVRRYGFAFLGFLVGVLFMLSFWREVKAVAEIRGYSMDEIKVWVAYTIGALIPLIGGPIISGSITKDHRRQK